MSESNDSKHASDASRATWPPLPPEAVALMTEALRAHREAVRAVSQVTQDALARAEDDLRDRLQVIATGGPSDESEASR